MDFTHLSRRRRATIVVVSVAVMAGLLSVTTTEPPPGLYHNMPALQQAPNGQRGYEGTLVMAPVGGPRRSITQTVSPDAVSITLADAEFAVELVQEGRSMGERLCLSDLGPQLPEYRDRRYWVFSC